MVLVTGGRAYRKRAYLYGVLDAIHAATPITLLIEGGANGADALARHWAIARNVPHLTFQADWILFGKAAGPMRNQRMVNQNPDLVVAFPGDTGTADCVRKARAKHIEVREV